MQNPKMKILDQKSKNENIGSKIQVRISNGFLILKFLAGSKPNVQSADELQTKKNNISGTILWCLPHRDCVFSVQNG